LRDSPFRLVFLVLVLVLSFGVITAHISVLLILGRLRWVAITSGPPISPYNSLGPPCQSKLSTNPDVLLYITFRQENVLRWAITVEKLKLAQQMSFESQQQ